MKAFFKAILNFFKKLFAKAPVPPAPVTPPATVPPVSNTPPAPALPAGTDTPDASGRVALTGLPAGNYYKGIRFAIAEVANALSPGSDAQRDVNANVVHANGEYNIALGMITVCYALKKGVDPSADTVDTSKPAVNTLALPSFMTVASATAHFAVLPDPNTNNGGAGFSPPKGK